MGPIGPILAAEGAGGALPCSESAGRPPAGAWFSRPPSALAEGAGFEPARPIAESADFKSAALPVRLALRLKSPDLRERRP